MSFFKNNKTNTTTTATENTATEETTSNGSLLKTLAIAGGTAIGIGAAIFGGRKVYKHFHDADETIDSDDDFEEEGFDEDDDFNEVPVNETPVESFNEVETEVTKKPEPAKAEEVKVEVPADETPAEVKETEAEETENKATVEVKEAKTEETKKPEPVEAKEAKTDVTKEEATKETETMKNERLIGEAVSKVPYDKPETVDLAFYVRCIGGCLNKINMDEAGNTGRFVIAEQCVAMTDLVSKAIMHMASANINDLEDYYGVYGDIKRLVKEFKASKIMKFTQKPELCEEKFEESLTMVEKNLTLTKQILKLKEAKPASKSAGETKTADNAFDAFKDGYKESNKIEGENQTLAKKVAGETKTVTKASGKKPTKAKASKATDPIDVINQYVESSCEELVKSSLKSLASLNRILDVNDQKPCEWLNEVSKYVDSNIGCLLKTSHKTEAYKLMKVASRDIENAIYDIEDYMLAVISGASTIEELDDAKESVVALSNSVEMNHIKIHPAALGRINNVKTSLHSMYTQFKTAGETKTAEPVVDEKHDTTKESPSETQIGNSTVVSDDGETVTLKASVSEESVQNVKDVIDIVSKIPNKEDPEKNDMPYYIRVIGGRISGITEPEATFLAYNDKTKSNDFIDACTDICDMTGKAICNLANSGKNPLASMQWIDRSVNELVASGIIDNTCNPNKYRSAILKAHGEAMNKLSKLVSNENQVDTKSSDETQAEDTLTYTMSEKIQEAVQQSDETAATTEPESAGQAPMSPEASSLAAKLQEVGTLMRAEKWSEAAEFYKTQLTPYLADDGLTKELREEIMGIKTKATNMMMSQKQIAAKQKAAAAKASKKNSKKRRRH